MAKKPPGCAKRIVKIKRKSGRVVATFKARSGKDCKPRTAAQRKSATGAQKRHRAIFAAASKICRRETGAFTRSFGNCMKGQMRSNKAAR
jgi:hypothetical protein